MWSSSSESDRTYDSSCSENSSDRRRFSSSAARRRSSSELTRRCRRRHNVAPTTTSTRVTPAVAYTSGCCRNRKSMAIYIHLSILRINLFLCLTLAASAGTCRGDAPPPVARVWPALGTMMSAAGWGLDRARVARALAAAHDSVDRVDSLIQAHAAIRAIDSVRREIHRRTRVELVADSLAPGYALDRAILALGHEVDSALLDIGGQYSWLGAVGRSTHRAVGVPDPDNTLRTLAVVDLQGGSVGTRSQRNAPHGAARSVTVLADDGLTANAWAAAFLALGCDRALPLAREMHALCVDSTGVRWATGLRNRVSLPAARAP